MRRLIWLATFTLLAAPAAGSTDALAELADGNARQAAATPTAAEGGPLAIVVTRAAIEVDWLFDVAPDRVVLLDPDEPHADKTLTAVVDEWNPPALVAIGREPGEATTLLHRLGRQSGGLAGLTTATATLPPGSLKLIWDDEAPPAYATPPAHAVPPATLAASPSLDLPAVLASSDNATVAARPAADLVATASVTAIADKPEQPSRWPWAIGGMAVASMLGGGAFVATRRTAHARPAALPEPAASPDDERLAEAVAALREKVRSWHAALPAPRGR